MHAFRRTRAVAMENHARRLRDFGRYQSQFFDRRLLMDKLPFITDALQRLAADLGANAFVVADHWKEDDATTAIASPRNASQLIYFCQSDLEDDTLFDYELETAPANPNDRIYDVAGRGARVAYEQLREIVRKHLEVASSDISST